MKMNNLKEIKKRFSDELNKSLFDKYNRKISATFFVNEFNLRAHGTSVIAYETGRKWLKGAALPQASKIQVLVDWLGLDANILFDINGFNDPVQESDNQLFKTLDFVGEHGSIEAICLIASQLTPHQKQKLLFSTLTAQYFSEKKNFIFDYDYFIKNNSITLQDTESINSNVALPLKTSLAMGQTFQSEFLNDRMDGSVFWNGLNNTPITNKPRDITDNKQLKNQPEHSVYYDTLTGLANGLLLNGRIKQAMFFAIRHKAKMALLFVDFDGFKTINDQYGRAAGDAFLIAMSAAIPNVLRTSDTLARLSGDKFVILIPELSRVSPIDILLNELLQVCNSAVPYKTDVLQITARIGCALFNGETDKEIVFQDLLYHADYAVTMAMNSGKNTCYIFDQQTEGQIIKGNQRLAEIQAGLSRGEFVLYYQPKVNMRTGSLIGVEALIRWNHPIHGLLEPNEFLPIIENHHLNNDLGVWVINTALTQRQQWQKQGLNTAISINIHPQQLQQDQFVESLKNILAHYPDYVFGGLEIEILESGIIHNIKKARSILLACQALGISFAIDDFGVGYSSLSLLNELPIKTLKIDRSFVIKACENNHASSILESICYMANKLNYQLIAEGIETLEQGEMLLAMNCDLAQGYYVAKPMSSDQIPVWLNAWTAPKKWVLRA